MKFTALATALALVAATSPAVAAPRASTASASSLSLTKSTAIRASAKTGKGSNLAGALENPAVSVVMAVVAVGGILLIAGAVANDDPDSN
jgi:hypothetical protein